MTFFNYTDNIPNGPNNPSNDQPLMQRNTNSTSGWTNIDHFGFNDSQGGYHNVIHQPQTATPTTISTVGQTYTQNVTPTGGATDIQLFYKSALGVITQLTGPNMASAMTNGYVWIGGILLQWGFVSGTNSPGGIHFDPGDNGIVTFATDNIAFPTNCFNVFTSLQFFMNAPNNGSSGTVSTDQNALSKTSFSWEITTGSSAFTRFFWLAIGN